MDKMDTIRRKEACKSCFFILDKFQMYLNTKK